MHLDGEKLGYPEREKLFRCLFKGFCCHSEISRHRRLIRFNLPEAAISIEFSRQALDLSLYLVCVWKIQLNIKDFVILIRSHFKLSVICLKRVLQRRF